MGAAFAAVFPAELPDKTMVATIVLATRFRRPLAVWCGVALAFLGHVVIAASAGGLLSRLDDRVVAGAAAVLFGVGAVVLWRESRESAATSASSGVRADVTTEASSFRRTATTSFGVVGLAELGDLTQLATAAVAARTGEPLSAGIGALGALWTVGALGAFGGRWLSNRLPIARLQQLATVVFAVLAVVSALEALS